MVLPWFYHGLPSRFTIKKDGLLSKKALDESLESLEVVWIPSRGAPARPPLFQMILYHIISYHIILYIRLYYIIYVYTDIYFVYVYVTVHTRVCLKIGCSYTPWFIIMFPIIIPFLGSPESPGWGTGATAAAGGAQRRFALRNMESLRRRLHEENEGGSEFEHFLSREF